MRHPPISAGMKWVGKILAYAFDVAIVQFFVESSIPVASPYISAAIAWANDHDGVYLHP